MQAQSVSRQFAAHALTVDSLVNYPFYRYAALLGADNLPVIVYHLSLHYHRPLLALSQNYLIDLAPGKYQPIWESNNRTSENIHVSLRCFRPLRASPNDFIAQRCLRAFNQFSPAMIAVLSHSPSKSVAQLPKLSQFRDCWPG